MQNLIHNIDHPLSEAINNAVFLPESSTYTLSLPTFSLVFTNKLSTILFTDSDQETKRYERMKYSEKRDVRISMEPMKKPEAVDKKSSDPANTSRLHVPRPPAF